MKKITKWIICEESGQGMVEYSLIIALVVLVVLVGLKNLGNTTFDLYEKISSNIS